MPVSNQITQPTPAIPQGLTLATQSLRVIVTGGNDAPCAAAGLVCFGGVCDEEQRICMCDDGRWGRFCQFGEGIQEGRMMSDSSSSSLASSSSSSSSSSPAHRSPEFRALFLSHITTIIDIILDAVFPKQIPLKYYLILHSNIKM